MKKLSETEKRIAQIQKNMRKVMPEIKRQIEVYEKNIQSDNWNKSPEAMIISGYV